MNKETLNQNGTTDSNNENLSAAEDATATGNQLLNKKAEDYLRESGNIEDMPDEEDEAQKDEVLKESKQ